MLKRVVREHKNNLAIAEIFYEMAEILEFKNVKWKPQAYRLAAQTLESLREDVHDIYSNGGEKALEELPGIGEGLATKIIQYILNEKIAEFEKLKKSLPAGLYEIMQVPGIGAKKANLFYNNLGIKNIKQLKKAAEEKKLIGLPGFKEKAEENILEGIELFEGKSERMPFRVAEKIANDILKEVRKLPGVDEAVAAGSIRRKKSTIGDIDIIVRTTKPESVLKKFVGMKFVLKVLGVGKEKATIITKDKIQVDVRVFTNEEFGAGLLYFTGDKQHNIWLRKVAIKKSLKLNEYGLFENKTAKRIAGETEEGIYAKLGLKFVKPENRIGEVE
jgi:DNA polymerase (family 10)